MKTIRLLLATVLSGVIISFAQIPKTENSAKLSSVNITDFSQQLDDIFNDPNFSSAQCGVVVQSLATGEYLYKRNEDKLFIPASNMKLFTTATALTQLGPQYRFKTEVYSRGTMDGSILVGDIIFRGFGDPTISGRLYNEDITKVFSDWVDSLLELGIDEIRGRIIGDDNAFDDIGMGENWSWDDETEWYSAPAGALSLNDNCVDIFIKPTSSGDKAKMEFQPLTKYLTLIHNVITVPRDSTTAINVYRERGTNVITVTGTIAEGRNTAKYHSSINNPTQFFINVFREVMQRKGIQVNGFCTDIDDLNEKIEYEHANLLFTQYSVPLPLILSIVNKNSQNFFAEQLLKVVGFEKEKTGTAANGVKIEKRFLEDVGINVDNLVIVDGSGLSRLNLVSPKQITGLLGYMYKSDLFTDYFNSLSIAGKDGTLAKRLVKTKAEENFHGKTGFVANVRSLSGYIQTLDGEWLAVSILMNNFTVPLKIVENAQDLLCVRLANFKR